MKRAAILGALAAVATGPVLAQTATLEQVNKELQEIKAKNDRLESEVEYLKEQTKAQRKDSAKEAVDVETLKTNTGKFTWSGDFRYRNEQIQSAPDSITDEHTQGRDRIRLRLGVTVKVNDTLNGRFQLSTAANGDPRSTNQTLGEDWTRKALGIDLAYVDWKALNTLNVQLGKMPQPWARTASYFWDGDLTPEGAALKFVRGTVFANVFYDWLGERHSATAAQLRQDSKLIGGQLGWRQPIGTATFTLAAGYFDVTNVQNEVTSGVAITPAATPAVSCTLNGAFFSQTTSAPNIAQNTNTNTNGNLSYDNNGTAASGCSALASDFTNVNAFAQFDFLAGRFPMSLFVDYMKNLDAGSPYVVAEKLDTAYAAGVSFNRTGNPKTWEFGVVYQRSEADSVYGQFHDSDFGGGRTDTNGYAIKGGFVPAANWIINATLFINKLNNDRGVNLSSPAGATTTDVDYKRLQLDLNFRF